MSLTHYNDKSRSSLAKMRPKWGHSRTAMKDVVLFQTNQGYYSRPHFCGLFGDEPGFREMQGHLVWRWLEQNFHIWTKIIIFRWNHLVRHLYVYVKKWIDLMPKEENIFHHAFLFDLFYFGKKSLTKVTNFCLYFLASPSTSSSSSMLRKFSSILNVHNIFLRWRRIFYLLKCTYTFMYY